MLANSTSALVLDPVFFVRSLERHQLLFLIGREAHACFELQDMLDELDGVLMVTAMHGSVALAAMFVVLPVS